MASANAGKSLAMTTTLAVLAFVLAAAVSAFAQTYKADVPPSITTPDSVETRIGPLKFFDGLPDDATVQKAYDQIDFGRGIEAFLTGCRPPRSMRCARALARQASSGTRTSG